jgi:hypothetical protein
MQERLVALKPNAFATSSSIGENGRVVNAEINLASDGVRHSHGSSLGLGYVLDEAARWIGRL